MLSNILRRRKKNEGAEEKVAERTFQLLERLLAIVAKGDPPPDLPVRNHNERLGSGDRGLSVAALEGLSRFYAKHECELDFGNGPERVSGLDRKMEEVCREKGYGKGKVVEENDRYLPTVCNLTRHTGLSLAETLLIEAEKDANPETDGLVGTATSFFSYSASAGDETRALRTAMPLPLPANA